jgi:hypothetical protein
MTPSPASSTIPPTPMEYLLKTKIAIVTGAYCTVDGGYLAQ